MTTTTVAAQGSKPDLVAALRATWRKSAEHAAEQVARFLRLTIMAAVPSVVDLIKGGKFDYITLLTFILPFAEVAYRQVFPALGAAKADSADGVTIVPEQVGVTPVPDPTQAPAPVTPDPAPTPDSPDVEDDSGLANLPLTVAKPPVKKAVVKKAPAKKTVAKKAPAKKAPPRKS